MRKNSWWQRRREGASVDHHVTEDMLHVLELKGQAGICGEEKPWMGRRKRPLPQRGAQVEKRQRHALMHLGDLSFIQEGAGAGAFFMGKFFPPSNWG